VAATAWTVQIRLMTASNAPAVFGKLAKTVKQGEKNVTALGRAITALDKPLMSVEARIAALGTAFGAMYGAANQSFRDTARSAAGMSRTFVGVGRTSSASLDAVNVTLSRVRSGANQAAAAIGNLALAAHRVPRAIGGPTVQPSTVGVVGAAGGGLMMSPSMLLASAAGVAGGDVLFHGIRGASNLQNATLQAAIATGRMGTNLGATTANMSDFTDIAMRMSMMTGQNIGDSMGVISAMASAGVAPEQLKTIYKPIAQFTDILHFGKDRMDYGESAKLGAGIVHDLRLFSPQDTAYGLGRIAQLGYLSPHGTAQIITQIRRMAPTLENILPGDKRQKATTITEMAAWADRMGNLPFAGSAISQMVTQMIAPRSKRVFQSMKDLGIYDSNGTNRFFDRKTGQFDVMAALRQVATTYKNASNKGDITTALLQNTQNAARIMQALTSPDALKAMDRIVAQRKAMGNDPVDWMNRVQIQLMQQLSTQTQLLTSNFATLMTTIANPLIPDLTQLIGNLATITGNLAVFFKDHPGAAKAVGVGLGGVAAAGAVAALITGGYIADTVFQSLRYPIRRALGHGSSVLARDALGIGSGAAGAVVATGGRGLAMRALGGAGGFLGLGLAGASKGFAGAAVREFAMLRIAAIAGGRSILFTRVGLMAVAGVFGRLALRAVPVIGQLWLLIDTIRFLGNHSKDIGKGIGIAARWIVDHGWPMIRDAFIGLVKGMWNILTHPGAAIAGGVGGVWDWMKNSAANFGKGLGEGYNGQSQRASRTTRGPQKTAQHTEIHFHNTKVTAQSSDPKKLADAFVNHVAKHLPDAVRAGGGTPQMGSHSHYAVIAGNPAG